MQTYGEYQPTGFDPRGLNLPDQQAWLVLPCGRNRDSDCLTESNFATALDMLGGESDSVEVHRFGHWACGWFEIILVKPDSAAAVIAEDIESHLADCCALDEDDWSQREWNAYNDAWQHWGWKDFADALAKKFAADTEAEWDLQDSLRDLSCGRLQEAFEALIPSGEYYDHEGSPNVSYAVDNATMADVERILNHDS